MKNTLALRVLVAIVGLAGPPPFAMAMDAGEKAAVCAGCHGPNGRSAVPDNPILAAQHADYLGQALQAYISGERDNGIMKTMAERLSTEDMQDINAYYAAQAPYQSQAQVAGDAARGADKVVVCSACHGPTGHSTNPAFPRLAGQHAVYLSNALKAYRSGTRSASAMLSIITESLSDQDIEDIAAYYAAQPASAATGQVKESAQ
jgi:cytochrome c553